MVPYCNLGLQEAPDEPSFPAAVQTGSMAQVYGSSASCDTQHALVVIPGHITLCLSRAVLAEERLRAEVEKGNQSAQDALYEMVAMKGYLNMLALDNWGLVFKKERSDEVSEILRGQEAIDYIESKFLSVVDVMSNNINPGRLTKDAVSGMLARLYLNAAVYRDPYGTPNFKNEDMDKVIKYTNDVISGAHALSPEYFDCSR
jgi:hypothetical protein